MNFLLMYYSKTVNRKELGICISRPPALAPNLYLPALTPNLYFPALAPNLYLPVLTPNLCLPQICIYQLNPA